MGAEIFPASYVGQLIRQEPPSGNDSGGSQLGHGDDRPRGDRGHSWLHPVRPITRRGVLAAKFSTAAALTIVSTLSLLILVVGDPCPEAS